jgi:hypothetical protein
MNLPGYPGVTHVLGHVVSTSWWNAITEKNNPIAGLEDNCVIERKDLADLVHSLTTERSVFVKRLWLMSRYPHRLLVITAALSKVKSPLAERGGTQLKTPRP